MPDDFANVLLFNLQHSLVFDCDSGKIQYSNDISKCDLVVMLLRDEDTTIKQYNYLKRVGHTDQFVCVLNVFHIDEIHAKIDDPQLYPCKRLTFLFGENRFAIVHHDLSKKDSPNLLYYDMLYARTKIYYLEYDNHDLEARVWTQATTSDMYKLDEIRKTSTPKHYLSPMRTFEHSDHLCDSPRVRYRKQLRDFLPKDKGYISDHVNGVFLEPQEYNLTIKNRCANPVGSYAGGTWYPVHNNYYNDSIISIYVESITYGTGVTSVTEKTFDPLIKGHFVLPYGYKGLIEDIKSYGFILPDWLDYSYDKYDDDVRWEKYLESVSKYINTPIEEIVELTRNDMHILHHNRSVFYSRPKDSLVDLIKEKMKSLST